MQIHVKTIGWLYIVLGVMSLLGAACIAILILSGGLISGDRTAIMVTSIVSAIIALLLLIISLPGIIAGVGLLKLQPWARIMALVLSVLNLPGFPFGTILGVYALYTLLDEDTQVLFGESPAS